MKRDWTWVLLLLIVLSALAILDHCTTQMTDEQRVEYMQKRLAEPMFMEK